MFKSTLVSVGGCITHQGRVAPGHWIDMNMGVCIKGGYDTRESGGSLVPGVKTDVLFNIAAERYSTALEVQEPGNRVDSEDIDRHILQDAVIEHGVGQHVAADPAAAPTDQVDVRGLRPARRRLNGDRWVLQACHAAGRFAARQLRVSGCTQ